MAQALRLVEAGCEIVRVTVPTVADARAAGAIRAELRRRGVSVPLVADVHFSPAAAMEAADHVEKVRINPGNYADTKTFTVRDYTDEQYRAELERIESRFAPLVLKCRERGVAMRIGTNHGSLSDRIMNRFGDTPRGMVESALEFLHICRKYDYHDVVLSMKASSPRVMVQAYRLLVARMDELGMDYPLHLGVTEAGGGEDGRIKSAIGIGALLEDGLGDTIRVSLTEDPEAEVPVAFQLARPYQPAARAQCQLPDPGPRPTVGPDVPVRRPARRVAVGLLALGGTEPLRVVRAMEPGVHEGVRRLVLAEPAGRDRYQFLEGQAELLEESGQDWTDCLKCVDRLVERARTSPGAILAVWTPEASMSIRAYRLLAARLAQAGLDNPLHLVVQAPPDETEALLRCSVGLGSLLCDGIGDSVEVRGSLPEEFRLRLAFSILQAAGARTTRAEYVACPGCGRTLFDIQTTAERIRARTGHLKGVKIAVMGCVVNGPGEMADADFGYVGGAPGRVNLYVGRECVERHVPQEEADERLIALIKAYGRWTDPESD